MSDLLQRLQALRGGVAMPAEQGVRRSLESSAAQLGAELIRSGESMHFLRHSRLPLGAQHGDTELGTEQLHPLLLQQAGAERQAGPVLYLDTETTGLAGGAGTFAFLIGVGLHGEAGFEVKQLFLPGPEHERSQLDAFSELVVRVAAVVTYNGGSFDLPLLRSRFALHGLPDPLQQVPHLDLLTLARRLWRETLPDCTLSTVERRILGARRSHEDVPGAEVPARYLAYLQHHDASGLQGVLEHNQTDIVALTALRFKVEELIDDPARGRAPEVHGLARWLERLGQDELALARYLEAGRSRQQAAWHASLLLKRLGRTDEAATLWRSLGLQGLAAAWVEIAKVEEHKRRDYRAALDAVLAAAGCSDADAVELERRKARLLKRLQ